MAHTGLVARQASTGSPGTDWQSAMSRRDSVISQLDEASSISSYPHHDAIAAEFEELDPSPSRRKVQALPRQRNIFGRDYCWLPWTLCLVFKLPLTQTH